MNKEQMSEKKYQIIYADPPWKYKESWGNGSNEWTYPTMKNKDIINTERSLIKCYKPKYNTQYC